MVLTSDKSKLVSTGLNSTISVWRIIRKVFFILFRDQSQYQFNWKILLQIQPLSVP